MPAPRLTTVVATVAPPPGADPDDWRDTVDVLVRDALRKSAAELVPCGWSPDPDTIAEATGVPFDDVFVLDLNPPRSAAAEDRP